MNSTKLLAVLLAFILLALLLPLVIKGVIATGIDGKETPLNPTGQPFELFRDNQGQLWISDYWAGEIWRVNPNSGAYTIYSGLDGAADGRTDATGTLWWTDLEVGNIGRLLPGENQAALWTLAEGAGPLGIAFGDSGQIWIADAILSNIYRFAPTSSQLCTYSIPNAGTSDYILFENNLVWTGDTTLGRILRFNPNNDEFTIWQLPSGAYPQGLAYDANNRLWWADPGLGTINYLDPGADQVKTYAVPKLGEPQAKPVSVVVEDGQVWYTDQNGFVGLLDPAQVPGDNTTISSTSIISSPSCSAITAAETVDIGKNNGQLDWTGVAYTLVVNNGGWQVYELPKGAAPWGLAMNGDNIWFNDQGEPTIRAPQLGWILIEGDPPPTFTPTPTSTPDESSTYLPVIIGE